MLKITQEACGREAKYSKSQASALTIGPSFLYLDSIWLQSNGMKYLNIVGSHCISTENTQDTVRILLFLRLDVYAKSHSLTSVARQANLLVQQLVQ